MPRTSTRGTSRWLPTFGRRTAWGPRLALGLVLGLGLFACGDDPGHAGGDGQVPVDARADAHQSGDPDAAQPIDAAVNGDAGLPDGPSSDRHTARPLSATDAPSGFYEYLPPGYGDAQPRPLLVFWHGIGENGDGETELDRVLAGGPPRLIDRDEWPSERPFVVLSPQHPGDNCPSADEIEAFLSWAIASYAVDPRRVYLTGLSCGAIGTWSYLGKYLDAQIAALVAIAGNGRPAWNQAGCDLGRVPIWGFHGDADTTVDPAGTIEPMTHLIDECPAPPRQEALLTIYPSVGHDSWSRTYNLSAGHDIYSWMLGFQKP